MRASEHASELLTLGEYERQAESFALSSELRDACADWLMLLPVSITRDAQLIDQSNFAAALRMLDEAGAEYQIVRFGHWAVGWVEHILVAPSEPGLTVAGEIVCALADYPILDEGDANERETEDQRESWSLWGARDYVRSLPCETDTARDLAQEYVEALGPWDAPGMDYVEQHSDGPHFSYRELSRDEAAELLRAARAWRRAGQ